MKLRAYNGKMRFLQLDESFHRYDIISEREAPVVMQQFAQSRWAFPMTLYFEAYPFEKEDVLNAPLPVVLVPSTKKIFSFTSEGFNREPLPAFMMSIENEVMLHQAFEEFFYVAKQNLLFALTNEPCLVYKGHSVTISSQMAEILLADYDGQAAIFITNSKEEQDA